MTSKAVTRVRLIAAAALVAPLLASAAHAMQSQMQGAAGAEPNPAFTSVLPGTTAVERSTGPAVLQGGSSGGMTLLERSGATGGGGQGA
ncbi:hypothetical protein [Roseomonas populi]|uniref:Uncharacterized protein n=1 Tax=Roseomonas populi TaxID=3121582 RepID=A0ABT1X020_9PROT|nr:hypothetical protein [Roseomonas pecuniae]MCR0980522.1 hypothetical protein [Roseomonas pecuniae]